MSPPWAPVSHQRTFADVAVPSDAPLAIGVGEKAGGSSGSTCSGKNSRGSNLVLEGHQQLLNLLRHKQEQEVLAAWASDPSSGIATLLSPPLPSYLERMEDQKKKAEEKMARLREKLADERRIASVTPPPNSQRGTAYFSPFSYSGSASAAWRRSATPPPNLRREEQGCISPRRQMSLGSWCLSPTADGKVRAATPPPSVAALERAATPPSTRRSAPLQEPRLPDGAGGALAAHGLELSDSAMYYTHSTMYTADGEEVPLENRDVVLRILHGLNTKVVVPLCQHFGLRHDFLFEQHCQEKKAGVARREPRTVNRRNPDGSTRQETKCIVTIRLRVRLHPSRGDPQREFLSQGGQLAVLLHELCHLRYMDHGQNFMLLLKSIYQEATRMGIFKPGEMANELPSSAGWENELFRTGGEVDTEELIKLFQQRIATEKGDLKSTSDSRPRSLTPVGGRDCSMGPGVATQRLVDEVDGGSAVVPLLPSNQRVPEASARKSRPTTPRARPTHKSIFAQELPRASTPETAPTSTPATSASTSSSIWSDHTEQLDVVEAVDPVTAALLKKARGSKKKKSKRRAPSSAIENSVLECDNVSQSRADTSFGGQKSEHTLEIEPAHVKGGDVLEVPPKAEATVKASKGRKTTTPSTGRNAESEFGDGSQPPLKAAVAVKPFEVCKSEGDKVSQLPPQAGAAAKAMKQPKCSPELQRSLEGDGVLSKTALVAKPLKAHRDASVDVPSVLPEGPRSPVEPSIVKFPRKPCEDVQDSGDLSRLPLKEAAAIKALKLHRKVFGDDRVGYEQQESDYFALDLEFNGTSFVNRVTSEAGICVPCEDFHGFGSHRCPCEPGGLQDIEPWRAPLAQSSSRKLLRSPSAPQSLTKMSGGGAALAPAAVLQEHSALTSPRLSASRFVLAAGGGAALATPLRSPSYVDPTRFSRVRKSRPSTAADPRSSRQDVPLDSPAPWQVNFTPTKPWKALMTRTTQRRTNLTE